MLKLGDFFHLPQLEGIFERLVSGEPGLVVVAGLDARPTSAATADGGFLPSGRSAIFGILVREILEANPALRAVVVAEDRAAVRVPRQLRRRVRLSRVGSPAAYADQISDALRYRPDVLVIGRLCAETAPAALKAARDGVRVLAQLDTVFKGAGVVRQLCDLDVPRESLDGLTWVLTVQRLATLCSHCKRAVEPDPALLAELSRRCPHLDGLAAGMATFFRADGCSQCQGTGRHGSITAFDVFRFDPGATGPSLFEQPSLLSLEEYVLHLAALGHLPLDDVLQLEADTLRRTYSLLGTSESALDEANATLGRTLAELEAANRVLEHRTQALFSLQDIGQALIASTSLQDLAARICRRARDLCGADRAILYFWRASDEGDDRAEVLAVGGWDSGLVHRQLDAALVFGAGAGAEPTPFTWLPPGVLPGSRDVEEIDLRAGLRVPLVVQQGHVGLMIVHSTEKDSFAPGEVALLQTFANQAAVAIQRAGLIDELRAKIIQLEAAQAELVQKERMERELELARQVQQSVLPRIFPLMPGYTFGARNEPARQVGGDFYDVVLLDADHFGLVIADVSDKGMPAALYMALTRSLLLAEARRERSPRAVLSNVNRLLLELGEPNMFVSVFYGVVEGTTRRLTYTRAGHDRPLLLREGAAHPLVGTGAVLGFLEQDELHLSEEQVTLMPGDRLVLYTDGLTDVVGPDDQLLGIGRLQPLLLSHVGSSPDEMCAATFADLLAHQGTAEQFDDMTMLVVGVK
jgi:sigma-B regulation protein RsbU (phosphoserine phosphatase)